MAYSLSNCAVVLIFSLLILLPLCLGTNTIALTYHGGPLLTGNINLAIIWYGQFGHIQKNIVRTFIKSLNYNAGANLQPQVSSWWKIVESYQQVAGKETRPINVRVVKQVTDTNYSIGKVITTDFIKPLMQKATGGDVNVIPVIFTARDVSVQEFCMGRCSEHGVLDERPYIMVGNPETECPGACAWPFHKTNNGPVGVTLNPPNGNVGADAMVISFAQALAEAVTNPYKTGFFKEDAKRPMEPASACKGIFGSEALPGYTGKVRVDPVNGGGFNAHGSKGRKFLVPAIWNPQTKSCWTLM